MWIRLDVLRVRSETDGATSQISGEETSAVDSLRRDVIANGGPRGKSARESRRLSSRKAEGLVADVASVHKIP